MEDYNMLDLMIGSMQGCLSDREQSEFNDMMANSEEHRKEYEALRLVQMEKLTTRASRQDEIDAAIRTFRKEKSLMGRLVRSRAFYAGISAFCIVALAVGAFLYDGSTKQAVPSGMISVSTGKGEKSTVLLADGTSVKLFENSKISYPADYGMSERKLSIDGAAYFDVAKNPDMPLDIDSGESNVKVLGTKFDLSARHSDSLLTLRLLEGSVEFSCSSGKTAIVPGEAVIYKRNSSSTTIKDFSIGLRMAWLEGSLRFEEVSMEDLCNSLSELYACEVLPCEELKTNGRKVTMHISNQEDLESVLNALNLIIPHSRVYSSGHTIRLIKE